MNDFITLEDIKDSVLHCDETDIKTANEYLTKMAVSLGVAVNKIGQPVTDTVKRLGVCCACSSCALKYVGTDPTVNMDGSRSDDIYKQKYELYRKELNILAKELTAFDFTGEVGEGGICSVPLYRS